MKYIFKKNIKGSVRKADAVLVMIYYKTFSSFNKVNWWISTKEISLHTNQRLKLVQSPVNQLHLKEICWENQKKLK